MFLSAQPNKRELNGDGGHWYYPDGRSLHTVPKKDGTGERNTTKADARKLGLFPSVTAITKIVANPSLDRWKQNQMLEACVNNPIVGEKTRKNTVTRCASLLKRRWWMPELLVLCITTQLTN